jgi:hypothetical protein
VRLRRVVVHFAVEKLEIGAPWHVGTCVLYPAHHVVSRVTERYEAVLAQVPAGPAGEADVKARASATHAVRIVRDFDGSASDRVTIGVPTRLALDAKVTEPMVDELRNVARDALAVLRHMQDRMTMMDLSLQRFGLVGEVHGTIEPRLLVDRDDALVGAGWTRRGSGANWIFTRAAIHRYHRDPALQWLDEALRTPEAHRSDWQYRVLAALRAMALGDASLRPDVRVILLATAYEAALGNPYKPSAKATQAHELARRGAYLWCGTDVKPPRPHRPGGEPRCALLVREDPRADPEARWPGGPWRCSWYNDLRNLSDARNAALHGSRRPATEKLARMAAYRVENVVEQLVRWIVERGATELRELDREIGALPMAPRTKLTKGATAPAGA